MGNSTYSLQNVVDYASTIGDLQPGIPAGGFTNLMCLEMATEVMTEMLAKTFNWKFNRMIVPPFPTISLQQDYCSVSLKNLGWIEHAACVDINNTSIPKPIYWLEAVRDLEMTATQYSRPGKVCWLPNDQLLQGAWPGAGVTYTNPIGAIQNPNNSPTNILDKNGNILVLTTYGVTGVAAPFLASGDAPGTTIADGTCVWTKADPSGQGFRLSPIPPQLGVVMYLYIVAQKKPVKFTSMDQSLDPVPDDYKKYFQDGFILKCHERSSAPVVRNRAAGLRAEWALALRDAAIQGDRERDDAGFIPNSSIMDNTFGSVPVGPAWPFGPFGA